MAVTIMPLISLQEPAKADVLEWKPGDAVSRRAFVLVKKGPQTFEAVVDITRGEVVSWKQIEGVEPSILLSEEWTAAQRIVRANRDWQAAVRGRGIQDLDDVVCIPHTVGYYGIAEEEGRRLVKVNCFESSGTKNFWGRPIEGLVAVVDHHQREVVKLIDTGPVPVPKTPVDFDERSVGKLRKAPNPITIVQPQGPSFEVEGQVVAPA